MNKTAKGALAAGAASVLLLGGAGSLAYWTATGTADGGSITAGKLTLSNGTCDGDWLYAPNAAKAGQKVQLFVPGDKVTKSCTFSVGATGDNLSASLDAPASVNVTGSKTSSLKVDTAVTYEVTKGATTRAIAKNGLITSADDASTLKATFVATIPYGFDEAAATKVNANDTQNIVATLDKLSVSLTQVNPNP